MGLQGEILFRSVAKMQTGGPGHYAWLVGRMQPAGQLCLSCPAAVEPGEGWEEMAAAMQAAVVEWREAGGAPPVLVTIQRYYIHPVDSRPRSFVYALATALRAGAGEEDAAGIPAVPRWCRADVLPTVIPLDARILALVDAGHLRQAAELLLALHQDAPAEEQRRQRERFLLELAFLDPWWREEVREIRRLLGEPG